MNRDAIDHLICPLCASERLEILSFTDPGHPDVVGEGIVTCQTCGKWHRIENGILDFLPPSLCGSDSRANFAEKYDLPFPERAVASQDRQKTEQIKYFNEEPSIYEGRVVHSPFYLALDEVTFLDWLDRNQEKISGPVLDVGCGTGRQSVPLARRGLRTFALDSSEEMLQLAKRKLRAEQLDHFVDLVVCDGEEPPVRDDHFSACVYLGLLHHLPNKELALRNASQKLMSGGLFYSLDPNASALRFLFDLLMRVWTLYDDEANESLVSRKDLCNWLSKVGIRSSCQFSTFLPPHIFYLMGPRARVRLLRSTDYLFGKLPGVRNLAGVIIAEGVKD